MIIDVECDDEVPEWFLQEFHNGGTVSVLTAIGWVKLEPEEVEFRNGLRYKVESQ